MNERNERARRDINAHFESLKKSRRAVIAEASRMIDAIKGNLAGVKLRSDEQSSRHSSAPEVVPMLEWDSQKGDAHHGVVGNLGEYFSHRFSNSRPGDVFNAGFYAAVLALKEGLIDPEKFHFDQEPGTETEGGENHPS